MFKKRKEDYRAALGGPEARKCLEDIARFCMATESCYADDALAMARNEGRRDVWLRIARYLDMGAADAAILLYNNREEE